MLTAEVRPQPGLSIPPTPTDSERSSTTPSSSTSKPPPPFSMPSPISASTPVNTSKPPLANLQNLPRNILAEIGYHLVVDATGVGRHPRHLLALLLTCKQICYAIDFDNHPQLYHNLFQATFDWQAIQRRYDWMKKHLSSNVKGAPKTFDLFEDPRAWATDYKSRWDLSRRSKVVPRPSGEIMPEEREDYANDLWSFWFLLTENDGKNYKFMMEEMDLYGMFYHYFQRFILPQGSMPGYPPDDGLGALGIWCAILSGADLRRPYNAHEQDAKIFWLRPYIFACFKYDISYAPWQQRQLPLCHPQCREHELDITMQSKALPYKRFGYTWRRAPPHFVLGAYLMLLRVMEKHRQHVVESPLTSRFTGQDTEMFTTYEMISSLNHDREWQRNSVCQDPHTSFGLPPLAFRGQMEGFWRGNFIHYSLDMYRKILSGDLRTLYTAEFSLQATEMEVKETVIKVRKDEVGGQGNLLDAGFDATYPDHEQEQQRILAGYGHELAEDDDPDDEGWTKEILLSGKFHITTGYMYVRGRIRAWDGLVFLSIHHETMVGATAKWFWRGYIHTGGYLIGRWRDTFTPANFRGYEGGFVLVRAGSHHYPPSFPVRLTDSLGLSQGSNPGEGPLYGPEPNEFNEADPEPILPQVEYTQTAVHQAPPIDEERRSSDDSRRGSSTTVQDPGSFMSASMESSSNSASTAENPMQSPVLLDEPRDPRMTWHGSRAAPAAPAGPSQLRSPVSPTEPGPSLKRARSPDASENEEIGDRKGKCRSDGSSVE